MSARPIIFDCWPLKTFIIAAVRCERFVTATQNRGPFTTLEIVVSFSLRQWLL
jgi:hypothetical protein